MKIFPFYTYNIKIKCRPLVHPLDSFEVLLHIIGVTNSASIYTTSAPLVCIFQQNSIKLQGRSNKRTVLITYQMYYNLHILPSSLGSGVMSPNKLFNKFQRQIFAQCNLSSVITWLNFKYLQRKQFFVGISWTICCV